jgi:hypothetical protein
VAFVERYRFCCKAWELPAFLALERDPGCVECAAKVLEAFAYTPMSRSSVGVSSGMGSMPARLGVFHT